MKHIGWTCCILLFFNNWVLAQDSDCFRITNFGTSEICLPSIEGYQECYSDSIVKALADGTEIPANMVLGFYLNDKTYEKKDSLGFISFDDYFKVYGTKQIQDFDANTDLLLEMQELMKGNFFSKNWDLMEKEIDEIGLEVEIGTPTLVKSYNLSKNTFTYVMLTKYQFEGMEPYTVAMTLNGLLINNRLVWMAYYLNYTGKETISRLQENSNKIVNKLMASQ